MSKIASVDIIMERYNMGNLDARTAVVKLYEFYPACIECIDDQEILDLMDEYIDHLVSSIEL